MKAFKYINGTSNEVIAHKVFTGDNFFRRLFGLLFKRPLNNGEALLIKGCKSIHTMGMRYSIDVLFIDEGGKVLSIFKNMGPWRFTPYIAEAESVLESRFGSLNGKTIKEGDRIIFVQ